jgi:hypothetical protein
MRASGRVADDLEQGLGDVLLVQRIDQDAVAAVLDDVDGAAVLGGDDGQAAGGGLDQRQPERLGQRRVDEDAAGGRRDLVQHRHLVGRGAWGRPRAVEVVEVDQDQDVGQHLLRAAVEVADVVAVAGDDDQVGRPLQLLGFAIGLDQRGDVLALVRARQGQDDRLLRRCRKRSSSCRSACACSLPSGGWKRLRSVPGGITDMRSGW